MKTISKSRWARNLSGAGFVAIALAACASVPSPTEQIAVSKAAVSSAVSAGGNEYASAEMQAAREKMNRANLAMTAEDYKNARSLAEQAEVDAQLAAAKARSAKARKAAVTVQEDSRVLRRELARKSQ